MVLGNSLGFSAISTGVTTGGVLAQLVALGNADSALTSNPEVTWWRLKTDRCSNFAMESILQTFNGTPYFGNEMTLTVNRTGDLIWKQFLVVDLPGIEAEAGGNNTYRVSADLGVDGSPECAWVNEVGHAICQRLSYSIGGQMIDTVFPSYMHAWEELSGAPGKRLGEMVGKYDTVEERVAASSSQQRLYIPFPFHYNRHSGSALPLVSLQFHSVQIHLHLESLHNLVQVSGNDCTVKKVGDGSEQLGSSDLKMYVDTMYVYLDMEERDRFSQNEFQQLTQQVQAYTLPVSGTHARCQLSFNHPCVELIWMVQTREARQRGDWFDFTNAGADPVVTCKLSINSLPRFHREAGYFRLVQPYVHHTNVPASKVYCYSFALKPEEAQPSGSLNFSRIDQAELALELTGGDHLICFNRNWNVLKFRQGLGGIIYAN